MSTVSIDLQIQQLNPNQREAVTHGTGPLLVLAGPGSGKTRVLTHRVAYLIHRGVDASHILALTFTNKAADEMRERIQRLAPGHLAPGHMVWTGTFHRFCARLLRSYAPHVGLTENFTIYDSGDSLQVAKEAVIAAQVQSSQYTAQKILGEISRIKSLGLGVDEVADRPRNHLAAAAQRAYPVYQQLLRQSNAVDFDDLLLYVVQLLQENPEIRQSLSYRYRYVLIDEYQDTNVAQYKILRALCAGESNLLVTGDPDQSIYGWRGATIENILQFERDFPNAKVVRLEQNYRSTQSILRAADQLIANNVRRKQKSLTSENPEGPAVQLLTAPTQQDEARCVVESIAHQIQQGHRRPRDFAIFYRVNWLSRSFEHLMHTYGIPYQIVHGLEFFSRKEIKDVLAYLHLLNNPDDNLALQRVINVPPRQIGKVTWNRLRDYAASRHLSILSAARQCGLIDTISAAAAKKIAKFVALYDQLCLHVHGNVEDVMDQVLARTGYRDYLLEPDDDEAFQRAANVDELLHAAREFDQTFGDESNLERFLEQAVLVNDTDAWEAEGDRVTLMTLHAAKGLEFPAVYIVGLEDGMLPHERSSQEDSAVEEERRLLFVGITRAQQHLTLSLVQSRFRRGGNWPTIPSRFLMELPREQMEIITPAGGEAAGQKPVGGEFDDGFDDLWDDDDGRADQRVREPVAGYRQRAKQQRSPLRTAADLMARSAADSPPVEPDIGAPVDPELFQPGMLVMHPDYGSGQIIAVTGQGKKRQASIGFFNGVEKTFRLLYSPLRPIGK